MEAVCDPVANEGLELISAGLDRVASTGVSPVSNLDAIAWIRSTETIGRRFDSLRVELLGSIDEQRLHTVDGHYSAKKMIEHHGSLSSTEANERHRVHRMFAELRTIGAAYAAAEIGTDQVRLLAKMFANKRVQPHMADAQDWFVEHAVSLSFREFKQVMAQWASLVDVDGAKDRNQRNHENRNTTLTQDHFDLGWKLDGRFASLTGAQLSEIFDAYVKVEYEADWEKARAEHGDNATVADLPRTYAQRRADALTQIFSDAANSDPSQASVPVHNIVWSAESYEAMLTSLETGDTPILGIDNHRCSTLNGVPIDPTEAVIASLVDEIRRVVVDSSHVVIDMGRARFFTGSARLAATITNPTCIWPGCHTHATDCQIDHLTEHSQHGRTCPGNGAPLCGKHNRHKHNAGYTIARDPEHPGMFIITRPNGTIVE